MTPPIDSLLSIACRYKNSSWDLGLQIFVPGAECKSLPIYLEPPLQMLGGGKKVTSYLYTGQGFIFRQQSCISNSSLSRAEALSGIQLQYLEGVNTGSFLSACSCISCASSIFPPPVLYWQYQPIQLNFQSMYSHYQSCFCFFFSSCVYEVAGSLFAVAVAILSMPVLDFLCQSNVPLC